MGIYRNDGDTAAVLPTLIPPRAVEPGDTVEHDGPLAGLVEIDAEGNVIEPEAEAPADGLDSLTKPELIAAAEAVALDTSGTKADIIARLRDHAKENV